MAKPVGIVIFLAALAYLVLQPLIRLQSKAFANGAEGYRAAFTRPGIGETIRTTIELALGSLAIALVLGTLLAWCASRLPPRLRILRVIPVLPIIVPAIASVVGWAFLLSPRPGYLNSALRALPWWSGLDEGPIDTARLDFVHEYRERRLALVSRADFQFEILLGFNKKTHIFEDRDRC